MVLELLPSCYQRNTFTDYKPLRVSEKAVENMFIWKNKEKGIIEFCFKTKYFLYLSVLYELVWFVGTVIIKFANFQFLWNVANCWNKKKKR